MADVHTRDASWDTDLIWHYFHETQSKAGAGKSYGKYFKNQDPAGELDDRHRVYEMLVDEPEHTLPTLETTREASMANYKKSKLPWNQNNGGFLTAVNNKYWCGSIIKIVFVRYMEWPPVEPSKQRYPNRKNSDAVKWTIENLKKNVPVRASLGGQHYVGIVGHRKLSDTSNDFLCIDPWGYGTDGTNTDMKYAGSKTAFLGISTQSDASWTYGKNSKIVQWVETP